MDDYWKNLLYPNKKKVGLTVLGLVLGIVISVFALEQVLAESIILGIPFPYVEMEIFCDVTSSPAGDCPSYTFKPVAFAGSTIFWYVAALVGLTSYRRWRSDDE